ncbi:MAG: MoaD/ThiS family protein [Lentisphaeria bacterium]|nr:MoaD/ThiS family protein [Lentisphaeria bacterium]NQZ71250.1 MoaD/ThiS family protein [Lentisphaeria bacterium]
MLSVTIHYFAKLREERGLSTETIDTELETPAQLYKMLEETHQLSLAQPHLKVAVNDEFVDWSYLMQNGDSIVFIPPVAGG